MPALDLFVLRDDLRGIVMLAKLSRGLGAVAIVGVSTFGMIYQAGPAQADAAAAKVMLTLVTGGGGQGIRAASPLLRVGAAAVCATGVGCAALGVAAAGMALYATQDMWVPWVKGLLDDPFDPSVNTGCGAVWCIDFQTPPDPLWQSSPSSTGGGFVMNVHTNGAGDPGATWYYHPAFGFELTCKSPGGVIYKSNRDYDGPAMGGTDGRPNSVDVVFDGCYRTSELGEWVGGFIQGVQLMPSWHTDQIGKGTANLIWGVPSALPADQLGSQIRVNCKRPDGTMYEVIGVTQLGNGDALMPSCVGADAIAAGTSTEGSTGNCYTLSASVNALLGPFVDQESNCGAVNASEALYPNCVGGTVACTYVIRYNGQACTIGAAGCQNWPALAEITPSEYQCYYGSYLVGLGACSFLERAYEEANQAVAGVGGLEATGPNTDGDPRTSTAPAPAIDPPTTPRVEPAPGTTTPTAPLPGEGSTTAPTIGQDCWPSGYSAFNPAAWVLQPIQCALRWAFIPRPGTITTDAITAQLDRAGIGPSVAALSTAVGSLGGAEGGCTGPTIAFDIATVHQDITPFAACTEPMSTVAGYAYAFISVITVIGGAGKIISMVAHGFGYGAPAPTWVQGELF